MTRQMEAPESAVAADRAQGDDERTRTDSESLDRASQLALSRGWVLRATDDGFALYGPRGRTVHRETLEAAVRYMECVAQ